MKKEEKAYIRKLYMEIRQAERKLRLTPMPELTSEDFFLFRTTGNRLVYENAYFGRRKYLTVYAILALWSSELAKHGLADENTDETDYIRSLEEILLNICREEFWALPAHIDFEKIDLAETRLTIDLFAAETAQALSEIVLRLSSRLSAHVTECVVREVSRRVLLPFAASWAPYSWWENDRCNWSAVCAGSIGMTVINMERLNKKYHEKYKGKNDLGQLPEHWQENCLKRVCDALQCYLDGMESDGACTEGLGYYNYGMSFYAAFAEEYEQEYPSRKERLMYRDKCGQIVLFQQKCYFGGGVSISFSDGSPRESFLPGLTAYLKHCYPQVRTPDYSLARPFDEDACYRYLTNERNISWLMKYADNDETDSRQETAGGLTAYLLPAAQWLICQNQNGNGFAAKGGHNDENHNHNDIGHFLCVYNGEMLLADLGAGEYTKDYFSDKRYDILCNRSAGHSVPLVNGREQCAGKEYCADRFSWNEDENELTISFAGAYEKGSLNGLVRRIKMYDSCVEVKNKKAPKGKLGMQLELTDTFVKSGHTDSITENIITGVKPVMQDGAVLIKGTHGSCRITSEDISDSTARIIPCNHQNHAGAVQTVWQIRWDCSMEKADEVTCKMWITFYDNEIVSQYPHNYAQYPQKDA
ncbi:MAG: heparinase II/III family protein [Lachnospiraceae bacterium]|nr:heparinase II/III family protein [Lachnospiraceae bacterium]